MLLAVKTIEGSKNSHSSTTIARVKGNIFAQKGLTIIEMIISIALLAIITIPFLAMFVHSTSTNSKSQNILEGTHLAQTTMEELYYLSSSYSFSDGLSQLVDMSYVEAVIEHDNDYSYTKEQDGYYIKIELKNSAYAGSLVKTVVKIYNNSSMEKLESQMETILSWKD